MKSLASAHALAAALTLSVLSIPNARGQQGGAAAEPPPGLPPEVQQMMKEGKGTVSTSSSSHTSSSSTTTVGNTTAQHSETSSGSSSGAPREQNRFRVSGETVVDARSGLTWQRAVAPKRMTPSEAKGYCARLSLGGATGWRLPTEDELKALIEPARKPTIDREAFPGVSASPDESKFWSSTPSPKEPGMVRSVDFSNGFVRDSAATYSYSVRCVRPNG